jgi:hypothetical protein
MMLAEHVRTLCGNSNARQRSCQSRGPIGRKRRFECHIEGNPREPRSLIHAQHNGLTGLLLSQLCQRCGKHNSCGLRFVNRAERMAYGRFLLELCPAWSSCGLARTSMGYTPCAFTFYLFLFARDSVLEHIMGIWRTDCCTAPDGIRSGRPASMHR